MSSPEVEKRAERQNVNEALLLPEKNGGRTGKRTCKPVAKEENHGNGLRRSWARKPNGKWQIMNLSANPKYHFLVVDDDPDLNTTFALMLEFHGHDVRTAHTGETALAMLEKDRFHLIITEYCLPRMQGDKLAAMIKQQWPDQPILMATANIEEIQKQIQPLAGVDGFLNKPFSMSQLREAILWVLDRRAGIRPGSLETPGAPDRHTEKPH